MAQTTKISNWQTMRSPTKPLPASLALIVLDTIDDVAVVARDIKKNEVLDDLKAKTSIPKGHKIARKSIAKGSPVRKYAQIIGYASKKISKGDHVHVHNLEFRQSRPDYQIAKAKRKQIKAKQKLTFQGYKRANGKVGTRNYIGVISTVNCSATTVRRIAQHFDSEQLAEYPNVDGVSAFVHGTGCGLDNDGVGIQNLRRVIRGYASHPNFAGILIIGLGCESNQIEEIIKTSGLVRGPLLKTMNIQSVGGLGKTVELGIKTVQKMLPVANDTKRQTISASKLILGVQCGGSDGWSGVTANPALGYASDLLVQQGGAVVLAETPEVYGAEHLLTRRAINKQVAHDLIERIHWWEDYCNRNHGSLDNNPSPGNKQGGLTTILEKSLGAVAKAGTTNLVSTLQYAEQVTKSGLAMMDSPGYDPASVTGQIASGCNLIAFTTGRGSAFGSKPTPTLKICTNSDTYNRMQDDMDINAGTIVEEGKTVAQIGQQIFTRLIDLASGEASKSEMQGLGDYEFVPWQVGATM